MARGSIIAGLDIGTHSIKALVVQRKNKDWEVLSYAEIPSFGLRKGAVVKVEETAKNIQTIVAELEKECDRRIDAASVNIGGSHLYVTPSDGIISVSRADQRISKEDVERVLQATRAINIPHNEEVLEVFPKEYIIDDQKGIRQPEGLTGVRLEAKVLLLCYFQPYFTNLTQAVLTSNVHINDIMPSPLAAAKSVLTQQQMELGVALIDFGAATTSLAVFEEGELLHLAIFPIGSGNITNDIAIGLKTEVAIAEAVKKQHGTCLYSKGADKKDASVKKIEVFDKSSAINFTKKNLIDIIEPRVSEILDLVQKELKKIGRQELLPGGVVITGGGAKLSKIKEYTKESLKLACEIGIPQGIIGLQEDPALATVAGLVLEGAEFADKEQGIMGISKGWKHWLRRWVRSFVP